MNDRTIYQAFSESVKEHADRTALMYKKDSEYQPITYRELSQMVDAVAVGLQQMGVKKEDRIAIISYNRPEWVISDLATLKLGGIVVPLYYTPGHILPVSLISYMINDSKTRMIFIENMEVYSCIREALKNMPTVQNVVLFDARPEKNVDYLRFEDLRKTGEECEAAAVSPDEIATIVYTSGTTGEPKGVMLTHRNIVSNALAAVEHCGFTSDDVVLSYLPLAHMFERTCDYYGVLFAGGSVGYAEDLTTAAQDSEKVRPTVVLAVPYVIEKVYAAAFKKVEESSPIRKGLVNSAVKNLNELANRKYRSENIPLLLKVKCSILDKLVASKFRKLCGGRIRLIVSGAAPLNRQIAKTFYVLGYNILEGYGLTETSPVVACNSLDDNCLGTVGRPVSGVEVRIGDNSEILIRGPNVMKGYYNKPEETAKVIDKEGWLHTGDQGVFDEKGHLKITGRIKEIIVTSGGKNVAPAPTEARISMSSYIDQVMLYGDQKKYLVALVVPNQPVIEEFAGAQNLTFKNYPELLSRDEVKNAIKRDIVEATTDLPSYGQIKAFALIPEPFSPENEMLTPTLKLKRTKIVERYNDFLENMYGVVQSTDLERHIVHL
ncbi:MAG: long-chain fatty acid--CoA ligase [candidate division WOR-3 bacterium]|nr:MAG: long-chain fatty acid--CoA ligase [candidate division WOR-3 bacterium]